MARDTKMVAARAPRVCDVCGRSVSANNYRRHQAAIHGIVTHTAAVTRAPAAANGDAPSSRAVSIAVGELLAQYRESKRPRRNGATVGLGRIGHGLPPTTSDPADVEAAIAVYDDELLPAAATPLVELRLRQRRIDLVAGLARLQQTSTATTARDVFVHHGARWAADNGIGYAAFRDMGLPASLLREAGIRP